MSAIRTVLFERDGDTQARAVLDIREFDRPASPAPRTWTELAKDQDPARRALVMDLLRQLDELAAGKVDEIHIILNQG